MSPQLAPAASEAESHSQVIKAQLQLREMILAGELPAGERIAELTVVQRLGISRTPVRAALMRLEQEGLLEAMAGGRGDRKSTCLNSSHLVISYAGFCLKKKH